MDDFNKNGLLGMLWSMPPRPVNGLAAALPALTANRNMLNQSFSGLPRGLLSSVRDATPSEMSFFSANPTVSGMASEDNRVVMNQASNLTPREKQSVALNEYARILMRSNPALVPSFSLTKKQNEYLDTTLYRGASDSDRAATLAARLVSGDPSAGQPTLEQMQFIEMLRGHIRR